MKRLVTLLVLMTLAAGCAGPGTAPMQEAPGPASTASPDPAPAPADPRPDLLWLTDYTNLSRTQLKEGLARLLEGPGDPREKIDQVLRRVGPQTRRKDQIPWAEADLDGDGSREIIFTQAITDEENPFSFLRGQGAALCVLYQKDGRWAADVSDVFEEAEHDFMRPNLQAVTDLTGSGHAQIVWFRPHVIATGPQPYSVYVTAWKPGAFTHLPGEMVISNLSLQLDGQDLLLTGISRSAWFIRENPMRTDRYRFVDGAFRLVDRWFAEQGQFGYDRLWDGLVAESVGRTADAEAAYRAAAAPGFQAHKGSIWRYNSPPRELQPPDMEAFATALRTFARFRLGGLLLQAGRREEAQEVLVPAGNPYAGLTEAMRTAGSREEGCQAAAAWAEANPGFLGALNLGVGSGPWTPDLLCTHESLDDADRR